MNQEVSARLAKLERQTRSIAVALVLSLAANALFLTLSAAEPGSSSSADIVTRSLTVVDEHGTPRIVIGAPVPSAKGTERVSASSGIVINDAEGEERFGVGVMNNGMLGMGFDAPPGVGAAGNPERVYIGVTNDGRGFLRVSDNQTRVRTHLGAVNETGENALVFLDWSGEQPEYVNFGLAELKTLRQTSAGE